MSWSIRARRCCSSTPNSTRHSPMSTPSIASCWGPTSDKTLFRFDRRPDGMDRPERGCDRVDQLHQRHDGATKGVELTHRNLYVNAMTFGWHTGVNDRDVYLWTVPMFHCNGWGMVYAITGMGGRHIILRKVDGHEILARVGGHGVTFMGGAPAVVSTHPRVGCRCGTDWTRSRPYRRRWRAASDRGHRTCRDRARLGVHPDLRPDRDVAGAHDEPRRAEWDELSAFERARETRSCRHTRDRRQRARRRRG